jgi:hypothetical protein
MDESQIVSALAKLVTDLATRGSLSLAADRRNALLRVTVVPTDKVASLVGLVTELMGPAVKPAGETAWWKNWFDPFYRAVGGIQREQTLFQQQLEGEVSLYCAFWPWASEPKRTSMRVGIACADESRRKALEKLLGA